MLCGCGFLTWVEARVEPPEDQQLEGAAQVVEVRHTQHPGRWRPVALARGELPVALCDIILFQRTCQNVTHVGARG